MMTPAEFAERIRAVASDLERLSVADPNPGFVDQLVAAQRDADECALTVARNLWGDSFREYEHRSRDWDRDHLILRAAVVVTLALMCRSHCRHALQGPRPLVALPGLQRVACVECVRTTGEYETVQARRCHVCGGGRPLGWFLARFSSILALALLCRDCEAVATESVGEDPEDPYGEDDP
jgi:hypothetical protein